MTLTISAAIKNFELTLEAVDRAAKTQKAYSTDLKQFSTFLADRGVDTIDEVTPESIEGWVVALREKKSCPATLRRKIACLKVFFRYVEGRGQIQHSPFRWLSLRIQMPRPLTRSIDVPILTLLLSTIEERNVQVGSPLCKLLRQRDKAIIRMLASTGMRVGELVSLQKCNFSDDMRTIRFIGKGRKERIAFLVMPDDSDCIIEYIKARDNYARDHEFLFVNRRGRAISSEGVRYLLRRIASEAGIKSRLTPHMLRHTAATRFLENGADIRLVQEFLGHSSIRSTERYTHVSPRHLREVMVRCHPLHGVIPLSQQHP